MREENAANVKRISLRKKIVRTIGIVFLSLFFLIVILLLLIQTKPVQQYARKKIVTYLEKKLDTKVVIRDLSISFPTMILLEGMYVEDQNRDTLLSAKSLGVDINMMSLLQNELQICEITGDKLVIKLKRPSPELVFNYQFIVDAFSSGTPAQKDKEPMKMAIEHIRLDETHLTFIDGMTGNEAVFYIAHFDTHIDTFDPATLHFNVPVIKIDGVKVHVY